LLRLLRDFSRWIESYASFHAQRPETHRENSKNYRNVRELEAKSKKLEKELKKAIGEERYEDAAVIRDSLKAMAETLQSAEKETATTS